MCLKPRGASHQITPEIVLGVQRGVRLVILGLYNKHLHFFIGPNLFLYCVVECQQKHECKLTSRSLFIRQSDINKF